MRKNPPAKWVLPLVVNPLTSTEWCVPVPDDPFHRAAFLGALASLGSAYKWADDLDHTAKEVAQVWRDIADNLERCMSEPQTIIAEEWEDTMTICESIRWNNGVLEGFCCGEWVPIDGADGGVISEPSTQEPGTTRPTAGQSKCYTKVLPGNGRWIVPFAVLPGDTVTVTAIAGSWHDGSLGSWRCADGGTSVFGACTHSGKEHDGGDPDPTEYHMQLIALAGVDFYSATDGPFVIAGSGPQQIEFFANDGTPSDNSGSISFRVCVENGEAPPGPDFCFTYDFTLAPYDWFAFTEVGCDEATYTPGTGWGHGACREEYVAIGLPTFAASRITGMTIFFDVPMDGSTKRVELITNVGLSDHQVFDNVGVTGTDSAFAIDVSGVVNFYVLLSNTDGNPADVNPSSITRIEITGVGTNPFGLDNC